MLLTPPIGWKTSPAPAWVVDTVATIPSDGSNTLGYVRLYKLSSTLYILSYQKSSAGLFLRALTLSGGTVTIGAEKAWPASSNGGFASDYYQTMIVAPMTATTFLVMYYNGSGELALAVGSVSGTTITYGTGVQHSANGDVGMMLLPITSTTALLVYLDGGASSVLKARVITISGTAVSGTFGAAIDIANGAFDSSLSKVVRGAMLDATHLVVYWLDTGAFTHRQVAFTVSSTTLTKGSLGTLTEFASLGQGVQDIVQVSSTRYAVLGDDSLGVPTVSVYSVSGTIITAVDSDEVNDGGSSRLSTGNGAGAVYGTNKIAAVASYLDGAGTTYYAGAYEDDVSSSSQILTTPPATLPAFEAEGGGSRIGASAPFAMAMAPLDSTHVMMAVAYYDVIAIARVTPP